MAPPSWAYQIDYFSPAPDEELICSICRGVFCDPVQCSCHHVFCRTCITKWLENSRNCPICRTRSSRSTLQEVIPLIKNMILKLQMQCHNAERGCTDRFSLESCENHVRECAFELVSCKNKPCKEKHIRKEIYEHEQHHCPYHYVRCKTCSLKISSKSSVQHSCLRSLKGRLKELRSIIKKKNRKIQELKSEVKSLRENDQDTSDSTDTSSFHNDFILSFDQESNGSWSSDTSLSNISNSDAESIELDVDDDSNFDVAQAFSFSSANNQDSSNISVEVPRFESPSVDVSPNLDLDASFNDDLPPRRPAKRRMVSQVLDSSEDEQGDLNFFPLHSPKRNYYQENSAQLIAPITVDSDTEAPGPSSLFVDTTMPNYHLTLRPRLSNNRAVTSLSSEEILPDPPHRRVTFETTLAMLEQYNLESDSEWVPEPLSDVTSDEDSSLYSDSESDAEFVTNESRPSLSDASIPSVDSDAAQFEDCRSSLTFPQNYNFSTDSDDEWLPH